MQLIRNVFKYLENYSINNIKLDNFDNESIFNFVNYTPIIDDIVSTNRFSFKIDNIDEPIIYNLDSVVNLSDRKSIEIDVFSSSDIDEDTIILDLCSGVNGNAIRGSFKNANSITSGNLMTLVFNLGNINNTRLRHFSNIRSLRLTVPNSDLNICSIEGVNDEYIFTYDDLIQIVKASNRYILNQLNMNKLPIDENLFEAIYKYSAYTIWEKFSATPRNTKKGLDYLKKETDDIIKYYLTRGVHPHLIPYTNKGKHRNQNNTISTLDELYDNHKELINIIYGYYR